MAVVYAVLCHRSPAAVAALVGWLRHPGHQIVLHADSKAPAALHDRIATMTNANADVHALESEPCAWGGWSLVDATLRAIGRALALPGDWRHFVLLSEHHVPLQPPATIAASLPDGASCIDTTPLTGMDRATRADLLHRFAHHYRELPGVGMFAGEARALDAEQLDTLRRGSQWVVLSRDACERLAGAERAVWAPFRDSLIPDETAIHSVLRGTDLGRGLDVRNFAATFMAWPHLGGGADGTFTDALARRARARGHLFIRKRPDILPPFIRALLPAGPAIPRDAPEPPPADVAGLANQLAPLLRARFPNLAVRASDQAGGPACLLHVHDTTTDAPPVCLLSWDMRHFKALLAWRRPFDGTLGPIQLGGYATSVLGARLPGLTLAREVHVPDLADHGFLTLGDDGDVAALGEAVSVLLIAARSLSPLAGGYPNSGTT
jgi:hypothetical protein